MNPQPILACLIATTALAAPPQVGQPAPDFSVKDLQGKTVSLAALKGKTVVLEWTNPGCPFVKRHYDAGNLQALQRTAAAQGAVWITVNSTNPDHKDFLKPEAHTSAFAAWKGAAAHTVLDPEGTLGQTYAARTTPHVFLIDAKGLLVYQGAVDDDPRGTKTDRVPHLAQALEAVKAGKAPPVATTTPYGCSVKFR